MTHRNLYEDTGFEFLPHIELGRPVDLQTPLGEELRNNASFDRLVSEIDQNEHGYLARFNEADRENLEDLMTPEEHRSAAGAVLWVERFGCADNDENIAIHVLEEHEITAIEQSSTSLLLEALVEARDREEAGKPTRNSSSTLVDTLITHLRERRQRQNAAPASD